MSNLIITVISIALVAVAALMSLYFGGAAFMDGQSKAIANSLISQASQISGAINFYSINNGGTWDNLLVSDLQTGATNYLSSVPKPSTSATVSNIWTFIKMQDNTTTTGLNGVRLNLDANDTANKVCLNIAQMSGGVSANPKKLASSSDQDRTPTSGRRFDCLFWGSGTIPVASDAKYIVYNLGTGSSGSGSSYP